jgi:ATP-dependent RNA helicase DDX3X
LTIYYSLTYKSGRTGRIGHRGIATSFFSERDEPLGSVLTRTLLETNQEIPDFLQQYVPEGDARANLKFEADSDFDPDDYAGAGGAGDAWGGDEGDGAGAGSTGDAWGAGDGANAAAGETWGTGEKSQTATVAADAW